MCVTEIYQEFAQQQQQQQWQQACLAYVFVVDAVVGNMCVLCVSMFVLSTIGNSENNSFVVGCAVGSGDDTPALKTFTEIHDIMNIIFAIFLQYCALEQCIHSIFQII